MDRYKLVRMTTSRAWICPGQGHDREKKQKPGWFENDRPWVFQTTCITQLYGFLVWIDPNVKGVPLNNHM